MLWSVFNSHGKCLCGCFNHCYYISFSVYEASTSEKGQNNVCSYPLEACNLLNEMMHQKLKQQENKNNLSLYIKKKK